MKNISKIYYTNKKRECREIDSMQNENTTHKNREKNKQERVKNSWPFIKKEKCKDMKRNKQIKNIMKRKINREELNLRFFFLKN